LVKEIPMNTNRFSVESLESRTMFSATPTIEVGGAAQLLPRPMIASERPIIYEVDSNGGGGGGGGASLNPLGASAVRRPTPDLAL
jgi:hypothetical protein